MTRLFLKKVLASLGLLCLVRAGRGLLFAVLDGLARGVRVFFGPALVFDPGRVKKILAIRLDRVGDVVLTTPALRAIKETYPFCRLTVLARRYTRDLLDGLSFVDEVVCLEDFSREKFISYLRHQHFDVALGFHPDVLVNRIAAWSKAPWRIGYAFAGSGIFLTHALADDRDRRLRHEVLSALEVVGVIGARTVDTSLSIPVCPEAEAFAEAFFRERGLAGIQVAALHPGSRQAYMRWPAERFVELCQRMAREFGVRILLIAGPGEEALVENIVRQSGAPAVMATGLSLSRLVALIKRCSLFVGHSTGPMHIAAALKVPVVAIFGSRHPKDSPASWGPWGIGHKLVVKDSRCPSCHPGDCRTYACLTNISVDDVFEAVRERLSGRA